MQKLLPLLLLLAVGCPTVTDTPEPVDPVPPVRPEEPDEPTRPDPPERPPERPPQDGVPAAPALPRWTMPEPDVVVGAAGQWHDSSVIEDAYVAHWRPGRTVTIGVRGRHGSVTLGHKYGLQNSERGPIKIVLRGMEPRAEIRGVVIYDERGKTELLQLHDLLISTPRGSRSALDDMAPSGTVIMERCTFGPDYDNLAAYGGAGMKWGMTISHGCDVLIAVDNPRGQDPRGMPVRYEEHWAYNKHVTQQWYVNNDMAGGNRTGIQIRWAGGRDPGSVVIRGNRCNDYGWDWETLNGGAAYTVWDSKGGVWILDNEAKNAKYGCLRIVDQGQTGWHHPDGYAHDFVVVQGNTFTNENATRGNSRIKSTREVWTETLDGELSVDGDPAFPAAEAVHWLR
jgi:hypothetical protein